MPSVIACLPAPPPTFFAKVANNPSLLDPAFSAATLEKLLPIRLNKAASPATPTAAAGIPIKAD